MKQKRTPRKRKALKHCPLKYEYCERCRYYQEQERACFCDYDLHHERKGVKEGEDNDRD